MSTRAGDKERKTGSGQVTALTLLRGQQKSTGGFQAWKRHELIYIVRRSLWLLRAEWAVQEAVLWEARQDRDEEAGGRARKWLH